jgi:hypothetical protein
MKNLFSLSGTAVWSLCAVFCATVLGTPEAAAKPEKDKKTTSTYGCARFDVDSNGVLDEKEKAALLEAFAGGDTALKALDVNNDGKLDESELAAIKLDSPKKKGKKKAS